MSAVEASLWLLGLVVVVVMATVALAYLWDVTMSFATVTMFVTTAVGLGGS